MSSYKQCLRDQETVPPHPDPSIHYPPHFRDSQTAGVCGEEVWAQQLKPQRGISQPRPGGWSAG